MYLLSLALVVGEFTPLLCSGIDGTIKCADITIN